MVFYGKGGRGFDAVLVVLVVMVVLLDRGVKPYKAREVRSTVRNDADLLYKIKGGNTTQKVLKENNENRVTHTASDKMLQEEKKRKVQ
ncbi:hypothetical protein E2C01_100556 [Portunus trituberculatus]|uniref:Uncharacterized protein n=1 Tax=Portunus trituberculatus TaxID=210409 RepID=A0A5B7KJR7_PORTR|nr:hypothetical protein [Portunus trituberculatus]